MALAFARGTPASLETLFALRGKRRDYSVVAWDWPDLCSSTRGANLREKVNVGFVVLAPLARQVILVVDSLNRANRLAGPAVHALIRVDVKHAVALIDAVHRAFINAGFVFDVNTG
jgi:hypothetical protein